MATVWKYRVWYTASDSGHVDHKWFDDQDVAKKFMSDMTRDKPKSDPHMKAWEFAVYETKKTMKDIFIKKMSFYITMLRGQYFIETPGVMFQGEFESETDAERALMNFMDVQFSAAGKAVQL